jgi:alanine-glyoxylate transaminase/serine-glyoxylate transaminase/serine-pyruvate transaminase
MDVPLEDHRRADYPQTVLPLFEDLKTVFGTKDGKVFLFSASGTGGWEAAISNTLSPGDRVLNARFGHFSHLWGELCKRLGLDTHIEQVEWGYGVPLERYREILAADTAHSIKAVLVTHNETATGVTSSIPAVRALLDELNHPALLYVDGVSAIGCI